MRWVQQASIRPHRCSVIPFVGNTNAVKGFFDTGVDARELDRVYVSVQAVEEMARRIGWTPAHESRSLQGDLDAERERTAELEAELESVREQLGAVQVLKAAGYSAARKPGRPPKQKVA